MSNGDEYVQSTRHLENVKCPRCKRIVTVEFRTRGDGPDISELRAIGCGECGEQFNVRIHTNPPQVYRA